MQPSPNYFSFLFYYPGSAEERGMSATRGHEAAKMDKDVNTDDSSRAGYEVYNVPYASARCCTASVCRYVPFMPSYDNRDKACKLRWVCGRLCHCRRQKSDGVI